MSEEKVIKAYKGFDRDLKCRGFQYEVGKEYELPEGQKVKVCNTGFHACESPLEVLDHYAMFDSDGNENRFCEVDQSGDIDRENKTTKVASSRIRINAEIGLAGLIKAGIEWIKEVTRVGKVNDSGDFNDKGGYYAKIGSSGYYAQIGSSGDYAKIGSSGDYAQIGSSGYYAQIGSSGDSAQIGSSGDSAQIGSSGYSAKIGSSGDYAQIGSSGDYAQIGSSGDYAQIGSSGDSAQIGSSGDSAKIGSSGDYAQIGSSGDSAKIGSSGDYAQIGSSGYYAQIGSSGDSAKITSTGEDCVICCAGHGSRVRAKVGSWVTLAEWKYDEKKNRAVPACVKTIYIDGETYKADTWYKLENGEIKEA